MEYWSSGTWNGNYFGLAPEMIGAVMPSFKFVNNGEEAYFVYTLHDDTAIVHTAIDVSGRGLVGIWLDSLQDWLVNYRQAAACGSVRCPRDLRAFHGLRRRGARNLQLHEGFLREIAQGLGPWGPNRWVHEEHSTGLCK